MAYEYTELEKAGEEVVYEVAVALVFLNRAVIQDPYLLSRAKDIYLRRTKKTSENFEKKSMKWIDEKIEKSYISGIRFADAEIKNAGGTNRAANKIENGTSLVRKSQLSSISQITLDQYPAHTDFVNVFRAAAHNALKDKSLDILRKSDDLYRQVAVLVGEKAFSEGSVLTRRMLSQKLLDEYAKKGLQCIRYKNGKLVSIDAYCEMLGRTITSRCALQASINRYAERGYSLGIVSAHFRACDLCTPYEGRVLSLDGKDKRYASIWDAELQGLFHPNCKHDISPYWENMPALDIRTDKAEKKIIDQKGYAEAQKITYQAQQKQRYIERQIRKYKRRELVALDEVSAKRAKKKVSAWQQAQRKHLKENTYLPRKYYREQV